MPRSMARGTLAYLYSGTAVEMTTCWRARIEYLPIYLKSNALLLCVYRQILVYEKRFIRALAAPPCHPLPCPASRRRRHDDFTRRVWVQEDPRLPPPPSNLAM